ncbi:MAG: hypothetical protein EOO65_00385 [Methanosarcinales archaeon]|nr:MAG: hypothetical protein EOO65_00385 [Methanosarcinales archaeon]
MAFPRATRASYGGWLALLCASVLVGIAQCQDAIITTVAGSGIIGDGGAAAAASFFRPTSVATIYNASSGGVVYYVADSAQQRIRCVDESGMIHTVAGTGAQGYSGDGGAATAAKLNFPFGVAAFLNASSGGVVLYIAEMNNNRIRRVGEDGTISTFAGTGSAGFSGDGGAATAAQLNHPYHVLVAFNMSTGGVVLYISDFRNHRIRRVDEAGVIWTVVGNGTAGFSGDGGSASAAQICWPRGMSIIQNASSGGVVLYIADSGNHCIRRVDEAGNIATVAGIGSWGNSGDGGAATAARLSTPMAVSALVNVSSNGIVLYIADFYNNRIRRVDEAGKISTVVGSGTLDTGGDGGPATAAALVYSADVSLLYNTTTGGLVMYIADYGDHRIRRVNEAGIISAAAGTSPASEDDGGAATAARFRYPNSVSTVISDDGNETVYISDMSQYRVRRVDAAGKVSTIAGTGVPGFSDDGINATQAKLFAPCSVSAVLNRNSGGVVVFIAGHSDARVRLVDEAGILRTAAGNGTVGSSGDSGAATAATLGSQLFATALYNPNSGSVVLFITDTNNHRIRHVGEDNIIRTVAGAGGGGFSGDGGPATAASLSQPQHVAAVYNESSGGVVLYIADTYNHRIRCVNENGIISTVAGSEVSGYNGDGGPAVAAALSLPCGVSALYNTRSGGVVLFIADYSNHRIRCVDEDGIITTVAGTGVAGFSGDGGPATMAALNGPQAVAASGNASTGRVTLFVADTMNNRIRRIGLRPPSPSPSPTFTPSPSCSPSPSASASMSASQSATPLPTLQPGVDRITTVVGNDAASWVGDGDNSTSITLNTPRAVAVHVDTNTSALTMFVADTFNHVVRRVNSSGFVETIAGTVATMGHTGDGGQAVHALLSHPRDVAILQPPGAASLVLYIVEVSGHSVRKVDDSGIISTVAGNGTAGFGSGVNATGNVLFYPRNIAVLWSVDTSSPVLYITDAGNQRVCRVIEGGLVETIAGNGTAGFSGDGGPATRAMLSSSMGIAVLYDSATNQVTLYIADLGNNRVRVVYPSGMIATFAGSGLGTTNVMEGQAAINAALGGPHALALLFNPITSKQELYVTDWFSHRLWVIDSSENIFAVAGTGTPEFTGDGGAARYAGLSFPTGISPRYMDSGATRVLFVADSGNNRIRKIWGDNPSFPSRTPSPTASSSPSSSPSPLASLIGGVTSTLQTEVIETVAGSGGVGFLDGGLSMLATHVNLNAPSGLTGVRDADTDELSLYLTNAGSHSVQRIDAAGMLTTIVGVGWRGYSGDNGRASDARLDSPAGLAGMRYPSGSAHILFIADAGNHCVRYIDKNGNISTVAGNGTAGFVDNEPATSGLMNIPTSVAVTHDAATGQFVLYVADMGNARVRHVVVGGRISTIAGTGVRAPSSDGGPAIQASLYDVQGVSAWMNASSGLTTVLIVESGVGKVLRIDENGFLRTIAGGGTALLPNDGTAYWASEVALNRPTSLALLHDPLSDTLDVYISEEGTSRVLRMSATGAASVVAGNGTYGFAGDGGAATEAQLQAPRGLFATQSVSGTEFALFIADTQGNRVRRVFSVDPPPTSLSPSPSPSPTMTPSRST